MFRFAAAGALVLCLCADPLRSADLLTTGNFEGTYHQDRWGVGRFGYFIVDSSLRKDLAPYEGRRASIEVIRGLQPVNPGPAFMQSVGQIVPLAESPLALNIECLPPDPAANEAFQLICFLRNTGRQTLYISNETVILNNRFPKPTDRPDLLLESGYTAGQMSVQEKSVQMFQQLVKSYPGAYMNLGSASRVQIEPQQQLPVVLLFDEGLPEGEYEFGARARVDTGGSRMRLPDSNNWLAIDIKSLTKKRLPLGKPLRISEPSVQSLDDGYRLRLKLISEPGDERCIVWTPQGRLSRVVGRLRAYADGGEEISVEATDPGPADEPWQLRRVADEGHPISIEFRQRSRFSGKSIRSLELDLLTDKGVESYQVGKAFRDDLAWLADTPFGEVIQGVKLRARPAKARFKVGEPVKLHLQAVNLSGEPIVWWTPSNVFGDAVAVEIDGERISLPKGKAEFINGWAAAWTCNTPEESTRRLPDTLILKPGTHSCRYVVVSKGGFYKNASGDNVPMLDGELASNLVTFAVGN